MTVERRGFLKLAAAFIGGMAVTKYVEPIIQVANTHKDWIEDKGDFCIVRVPDFKTFSSEVIEKPVIFILGANSVVRYVDVLGYVNLYGPNGGMVDNCRFDASRMVTEHGRHVVKAKGESLVFINVNIISSPLNCAGFQIFSNKELIPA